MLVVIPDIYSTG